MKQIAILSDTHGVLREEILKAVSAADYFLHAGDVCTQAVLSALRERGDGLVARGNNDWGLKRVLHPSERITLEGVRFFLIHNERDVPPKLEGVDVVVYGHSHRFCAEVRDGVLWLNPGSCGRRRFGLALSYCKMTVDNGRYRYEQVILSEGAHPHRGASGFGQERG